MQALTRAMETAPDRGSDLPRGAARSPWSCGERGGERTVNSAFPFLVHLFEPACPPRVSVEATYSARSGKTLSDPSRSAERAMPCSRPGTAALREQVRQQLHLVLPATTRSGLSSSLPRESATRALSRSTEGRRRPPPSVGTSHAGPGTGCSLAMPRPPGRAAPSCCGSSAGPARRRCCFLLLWCGLPRGLPTQRRTGGLGGLATVRLRLLVKVPAQVVVCLLIGLRWLKRRSATPIACL